MLLLLYVLVVVVGLANAAAPQRPHILFLLSDDYGWANVGYHNLNNSEVVTPNLNALKDAGIELDRHYAYSVCSPTRSALLSGRNPIHVNVYNLVQNYNPNNNLTGFAGIPLRMTLVSEKLKQAGYTTRYAGKWDAGLATVHHLPVNRGFDSGFGYLQHSNDYWSYGSSCKSIDLWDGTSPAYNNTPPAYCDYTNQTGCTYEDDMFNARVLADISAHDPATPLFYYYALHSVHEPLTPPQSYLDKFSGIDNNNRKLYAAMVNYMDDNIGKVVALLKSKGMWDNTIIVWSSDNGGPVKVAATNYPLRGGKTTNWDGGIRVSALVSGGFVPQSLRGTKSENFITIWDWYSTFCNLAGIDPTDTTAAHFGLPPIDSYNVWPMLTQQNTTNPRTEIPIGFEDGDAGDEDVVVQGIIVPPYKLLVGNMNLAWWQGPVFPNKTTNYGKLNNITLDCTSGCLYNIVEDPSEINDISTANPQVKQRLLDRISYYQSTVLVSPRGAADPNCCKAAVQVYKGFLGPWVQIDYPAYTTTTTTAATTTTTASTTTAKTTTTTTATTATTATSSTTTATTSGASSTATSATTGTAAASTSSTATTEAATTATASTTSGSSTADLVTSGATSWGAILFTLLCSVFVWIF